MSFLDNLKSLTNIPAVIDQAKGSAMAPFEATNRLTNSISNAANRINSGEIEKKINSAVTAAEIYFALTLGFQAIAAFSAVGLLVVGIKSLKKSSPRRAPARRKARNPRRRKGGRR